MGEKITINPITRLEGHGKIEIFLDDQGNVKDAFFQVTELRGFERFCLGRPAEEMPRIVPNICGVCPTPHNIASTKALDDIYGVEPPYTAKLIRRLQFMANYIEDHYIHFFFLAAPDFILGPHADPGERNILGVIKKVGLEIGKQVIDIRKKTRDIIRLIASKPAHPEGGLPGGVPRGITEDEKKEIRKTAAQCVEFARFAIKMFKDTVLRNKDYLDLIFSDAYNLKTYYMGLVDGNKKVNFYEGNLRVVNHEGEEVAFFEPHDYIEYLGEWVEPWTYIRLTHLRKIGWKGLVEGDGTSLYRVGPLARFNVSEGMETLLAQGEYEEMVSTLGKPAHHTLAYNWARLIEALQAAEELQRIANDPQLTSREIRNMDFRFQGKGVGCVEACRGTLIHNYETDDKGLITKVNLIVATQHNAAPICMSVKKAAQGFIRGGKVHEGLLNMAEMAFRAYDPCLGCATHTLPGQMPLEIRIRDCDGNVVSTLRKGI
jgi:F420-non-reducing hydrogenase large subunit